MEVDKVDYRVRVTNELLSAALIDMLKKKTIKSITIKGLCEAANINRTTFYAHYKDIDDLVSQIEKDLFTDLKTIINRCYSDRKYLLDQIYVDVFKIVAKRSDLFYVLISKNADPSFVQKVSEMGKDMFVSVYKSMYPGNSTKYLQYYYVSVLSSFIAIIRFWLDSNMSESIYEIAKISKKIITEGIGFITPHNT